jgi:hypothetical protein
LVKCEPGPDGLGRVTFNYRKSGSRRWRAMTVTADEFIRRFLQHVLPSGFQKVRHYGFCPSAAEDRLRVAQDVGDHHAGPGLRAAGSRQTVAGRHASACPACGEPMTYLGFVPARPGSVIIHDSS